MQYTTSHCILKLRIKALKSDSDTKYAFLRALANAGELTSNDQFCQLIKLAKNRTHVCGGQLSSTREVIAISRYRVYILALPFFEEPPTESH